MQRPDEAKRRAIVDAAARMFATKPFHEVRLDDVAAAAHIGKGTLYVYFDSKDDLYASAVYDGLSELVERLRKRLVIKPAPRAWDTLAYVVKQLVEWVNGYPDFFQQMLPSGQSPRRHPQLNNKRRELGTLIESVIRHGVRTGELVDPRPELTAQFIPAFVRSAFRHGPRQIKGDELAQHVLRVLGHGILKGRSA